MTPVVVNGPLRNVEHLGDLLDRETSEEAKGHDRRSAFVVGRQVLDRPVEGDELVEVEELPARPRLTASRSRAWFINSRRMTWAPTARKWVRPFQLARVWRTSFI